MGSCLVLLSALREENFVLLCNSAGYPSEMPDSSIRNTPRNHTFDIKLTKHIMCRRTRVCVCVCECTSICMYICVSVCIWTNECMCVSSYICLWMNMCAYMSMDPYAYVWAYICACMDAYTHLIKFNKHGQDLLTTKSIFLNGAHPSQPDLIHHTGMSGDKHTPLDLTQTHHSSCVWI